MKKNLFYLFALICSMSVFTACKDDEEPEVPPTIEDVVAEYSGENLKLAVEGAGAVAQDAKIELAKSDASDKVTIVLFNVVPGVTEFKIPNAEFSVITKSIYASTLKGEVSDNVSGYNVKVEGTVDEKVLTANVILTEIEGDTVNVTSFYKKVYKGDMDINVSNIPNPVTMEQRVYISEPYSYKMEQRDTAMIKLAIKNFAFEGIELGDITVDTIPVVKRGEVYAFGVEARTLKLQDPIGEVTADLNGTIIGEDMTLKLNIDALGLKVKVAFQGGSVVESQTVNMEEMIIESAAILEQKKTGTTSLTLKIWDNTPDKDLLLTPSYKVTDKGSVEYILVHVSGQEDVRLSQDQIDGKQPIDFSVLKGSDDYIKYHMVAEDPNTTKDFLIKIERFTTTMVFDMKEWGEKDPVGLTSSNDAAALLPLMGIIMPEEPAGPVVKAADGAARITTFKTLTKDGHNPTLVPAITAGTLFTGVFSINISSTLKSTKFGLPYNKKPSKFSFTYKYTPGSPVYQSVEKDGRNHAVLVDDKDLDQCSIAAYLFEVSSYDETLDGTNVNTSSKVILKAELTDGTAKSDYQEVTVDFKETGNGSYDATKKYKLAIVCTSSKWGDQFMGADLSSLYVKYLAVE